MNGEGIVSEPELLFDTVERRVEIAGRAFTLVAPADPYPVLEAFLDEDQKGPDRFAGMIWPSALALARFCLTDGRALFRGPVLDLGTGLGVTALAVAGVGFEVVATDAAPFALDLLRRSARLNALDALVTTRVHRWGEPLGARFETLIGADLLYREESHEPLLATLDAALAPGGAAWLADPGREASAQFLDRLGSAWKVVTRPLEGALLLHRLSRA